jgi:hypothetical protein
MAGSIRRQQVPSASSERAQRGQETPAAARSDGRRGIPNAISASAFEPNASPSTSRPCVAAWAACAGWRPGSGRA